MNAKQRKVAARLHRERKDPAAWSEEPDHIQVQRTHSEVVSFRIPTEEFRSLHSAATQNGESISEFIRRAITLRIAGAPLPPRYEAGCNAVRTNFHTPHALAPRATPDVARVSGDFERASRRTS